jgi:hypothetical protein
MGWVLRVPVVRLEMRCACVPSDLVGFRQQRRTLPFASPQPSLQFRTHSRLQQRSAQRLLSGVPSTLEPATQAWFAQV